ncbi:MAG: hypothetical protein IPP88_09435 [Betaproteobacteria bacterium]|nr:hypothetical protein [Betaproteobacteria bacterium]
MLKNILKAGVRMKSAVCDAEIMVIKVPGGECQLSCGGHPMIAMTATRDVSAALSAAEDNACLVGKRYADAEDKIEVLCTKGGKGAITANSQLLTVKQAKALPSSD